MATTRKQSNGKNVEIAPNEVIEMKLETPVVSEVVETEEAKTPSTPVETPVDTPVETPVETPTQYTAVEIVCNDCDDLGVDELKQVIEYCSSRIDELQREEVEALEAEMRAIQEKLMAMKGHKYQPKVSNGGDDREKRSVTPLVNPNNPSEVYTFGKHPDWVVKLMEKTGKSVYQLREEAETKSTTSKAV